jgi:hypothetical protein
MQNVKTLGQPLLLGEKIYDCNYLLYCIPLCFLKNRQQKKHKKLVAINYHLASNCIFSHCIKMHLYGKYYIKTDKSDIFKKNFKDIFISQMCFLLVEQTNQNVSAKV